MKKSKTYLTVISIILLIGLIFGSIVYVYYTFLNNNIDDLDLTIQELKLYDYNKEALNDAGNSDAALDLQDYHTGYPILLNELTAIEEYFDIELVYFLVNYSTTSKDASFNLGIKSETNLEKEKVQKLIKWLEKNNQLFIGKNDLVYQATNIDVYKEFDTKMTIENYNNVFIVKETIYDNKDYIESFSTEKEMDTIKAKTVKRTTLKENQKILEKEYDYDFYYELNDATMTNDKTKVNVRLIVDEKEFNQLTFDEKIHFVLNYHDINSKMNDGLYQTNITIIDKSNELLFDSLKDNTYNEMNYTIKK